MKRLRNLTVVLAAAMLAVACVTINVYFPEAAAERAADRFIQDVIGPEDAADEVSFRLPNGSPGGLLGWIVPSAHAQSADLDVQTPQIRGLREQMAARHQAHLAGWLEAGAIGLGNDGLIKIRDRSAVGLAQRRELEQVVTDENADRRAVYREIAVANGHPDWESQIRDTFARRWIANARPGWFYEDSAGNWQQK